MRYVAILIGLVLFSFSHTAAQQTRLTEVMIKTAELEIPQLVELLQLEPGMTVADVGAGFGAWTMSFSRWIGPSGHVYATDLGEPQLASLRAAKDREQLTNVTVLEGATNATKLPAACYDAIIVRDVYHHLTSPEDMVRSLASALEPGGRLAVIDFPPRPNSDVPSGVPENRNGHGVPPEVVTSEAGSVLTHVRTIPDCSPESQPASLFLVLLLKP